MAVAREDRRALLAPYPQHDGRVVEAHAVGVVAVAHVDRRRQDQHLDVITGILAEIEAGRMLVTVEPKELIPVRDTLCALADALNEKLVAAEPVVDHSALLARRYRMAEINMQRLTI